MATKQLSSFASKALLATRPASTTVQLAVRALATYTPETLRPATLLDAHSPHRLMRTLASHVVEAQAPRRPFRLRLAGGESATAFRGSLSMVEATMDSSKTSSSSAADGCCFVEDVLSGSWRS
jgi:hypothetical protein